MEISKTKKKSSENPSVKITKPSKINYDNEIQIIHEINQNASNLINENKIDAALNLLKNGEEILEKLALQAIYISRNMIILLLHNMACCYQKLNKNDLTIAYLEAVINHFNKTLETSFSIISNEEYFKNNNSNDVDSNQLGDLILQLRFSSKFHLQMCAGLSQLKRHDEALKYAKLSILMCEDNLMKTKILIEKFSSQKQIKTDEFKEEKEDSSFTHEKIIDTELILEFIVSKIKSFRLEIANNTKIKSMLAQSRDMENLPLNEEIKKSIKLNLGVTQEDDWIFLVGIGNIMYINAINLEDLNFESDPKFELLRDAIIEKIIMLAVSYFSMSTELRNLSEKQTNETLKQQQFSEAEIWNFKAVELACSFLPGSCPIVKLFVSSYNKFFSSKLSTIPEDRIVDNHIGFIKADLYEDKYENAILILSKTISIKPIVNEDAKKKIIPSFSFQQQLKTPSSQDKTRNYSFKKIKSETKIKSTDNSGFHIKSTDTTSSKLFIMSNGNTSYSNEKTSRIKNISRVYGQKKFQKINLFDFSSKPIFKSSISTNRIMGNNSINNTITTTN